MTTPAQRAAARANGRLGGRPRKFPSGSRNLLVLFPEADARLLDLLAVTSGRTLTETVCSMLWAGLAAEGLTPTWGTAGAVPSGMEGRAGASAIDRSDQPGGPSELPLPAMDRAALHSPGWGACKG